VYEDLLFIMYSVRGLIVYYVQCTRTYCLLCTVYEDGSCFHPSVLDITSDDILAKFKEVINHCFNTLLNNMMMMMMMIK